MGFIVQIWSEPAAQPRPTSLQEAMALQDRALAQPASTDVRWHELTRQLLDRYPTDVEEFKGYDGVWGDTSLASGCEGPCTVLAIRSDFIDEVMPFVARTANRLGMNVTNFQSGTIFLADGTFFALPQYADEEACSPALAAYHQGDHRAAWEALLPLAEAGNRFAISRLAGMYQDGKHVMRKRYVACALYGVANGWRIVDGRAVAPPDAPESRTKALQKLRASLEERELGMADMMLPGLCAPGRFRESLLLAHTARERQYAAALAALDAGDVASGAAQLEAVARLDHGPAQCTLARLWAIGAAAPTDPMLEFAWTLEASKAGDDAVTAKLVRLFEEGVLIARNIPSARHLLRRLVAHGKTAAVREAARVELDRLVGPPRNRFHDTHDLAALQAQAEQGDIAATYTLAMARENGHGNEGHDASRDLVQAARWYGVAAHAGHAQSQQKLGQFHDAGYGGLPKDAVQAAHWFGSAAAQGLAHSQFELALRYAGGLGVTRDPAQSLHWLERSASQGCRPALERLAQAYVDGTGVPVDLLKAQVLNVLAARTGDVGGVFLTQADVDGHAVRQFIAAIDAEVAAGGDLVTALARRPSPKRGSTARPVTGAPRVPAAPAGMTLAPMAAPDATPRATAAGAPAQSPTAPSRRPSSTRNQDEEDDARFLAEATARDDAKAATLRTVQTALVASLAIMVVVGAVAHFNPAAHIRWGWFIGSGIAAWAGFKAMQAQEETLSRSVVEAVLMLPPFFGQAYAARLLYRVWRALN